MKKTGVLISTLILVAFTATAVLPADDNATVNWAKSRVLLIKQFDRSGKPIRQGAGFFISDDGLFVTSYQILGAEPMEQKGVWQSFAHTLKGTRLPIKATLAEDASTGVAVGIVELPAGAKTPYLKLWDNSITGKPDIWVIGHPQGKEWSGSKGAFTAYRPNFAKGGLQGPFIEMTMPAIEGSEGAPVVGKTGYVGGVYLPFADTKGPSSFASAAENVLNLKFPNGSTVRDNMRELYSSEKLQSGSSPTSVAQSKGEGQRLFDEGRQLYMKDKSKEGRDKALQKYSEALTAIRKEGDVKLEAVTLNNMGYINRERGDYANALRCFEESLEVSRKSGNIKQEARALNGLTGVYRVQAEYDKALEFGGKALEIVRKQGDEAIEADVVTSLGNVYLYSKQYQKALEQFQRSLDLAKKLKNVDQERWAYNNIGAAFGRMGDHQKAVDNYQKALELAKQRGDLRQQALTLDNIGINYLRWGQHQKALEFHNSALAAARQSGAREYEGLALEHTGRVHAALKQYEQAEQLYQEALAIDKEVGNVYYQRDTLNDLGNLYKQWGQQSKAKQYFDQAREITCKLQKGKC